MSASLYLVRLWQGYRFPEQTFTWRRASHPTIIACFTTREAAENYTKTHIPTWQNPFDTYALYTSRWSGIEAFRWEEDAPKEPTRIIPWYEFLTTLDTLKLSHPILPPNDDEDEVQVALRRWWDESQLTETAKASLWKLIDPTPYRIDIVHLEEST